MSQMTHQTDAAPSIAGLEASGIETIIGTVVNPAGLIHAKTVPPRRLNAFADPGFGASPVWHVFAADQTGIAVTKDFGVVGDERIRIDLTAMKTLGEGLAWGPGSFFGQDGRPISTCSRGTLQRIEDRLRAQNLEALVGHEIEFVLVGPDGGRLPSHLWAQYGAAGVLEHEGFVRDVTTAAAAAGVGVEQFHPEYGLNQFEISLSPLPPVAAADQLVLMRLIVGRIARRYGTRVSFSPVPFAGSVGSGAHQHFSLTRAGAPLFSGGPGAVGMTGDGEHAVGGVLAGLSEAQGVLSGSVVSGLRLEPGFWSGASVCWGAENREAAVRVIAGGAGNPHGANVEVKPVDPSANPYFASAAILGLALDGIEWRTALPPEVVVDPGALSEGERERAGVVVLPTDHATVISALDGSSWIRGILGDSAVDAIVAVRRYEHDTYGELEPEELTAKFRMAWSV
jgi:glutamine synthetase